ncbi:integron integrase, partial [Gloeomargarita lithophora Alchichica-D10]
CYTAIAATG